MHINTLVLGGNLTRDPEVIYTPRGTAVCNLSLANNRTWTNDQGEQQQSTTFIEARAFGRTAEMLGQHFYKGRPICIEGRLAQESWTDKTTQKQRTKTMVIIERVHFCGDSKQGRERPGTASPDQRESSTRGTNRPAPPPAGYKPHSALNQRSPSDEFDDGPITDGLDDDDIPF